MAQALGGFNDLCYFALRSFTNLLLEMAFKAVLEPGPWFRALFPLVNFL